MGFWSNVGKGALSTMTGGIYNPNKGGKIKMPKEQEYSMQKSSATKQAGGGQINFTEEKMGPTPPGQAKPPKKPSIINPNFKKKEQAPLTSRQQAASDMLKKLKDGMDSIVDGSKV